MKKIIVFILIAILVVACTPKEEEAQDNHGIDVLSESAELADIKEELNAMVQEKQDLKVYIEELEANIAELINQNSNLHLEDDNLENPEALMEIIKDVETFDELMEVYFTYNIDGAYAEQFAGRLYGIYDQIEFEKFVMECSRYGPVIQNHLSSFLVYYAGYFDDGVNRLKEDINNLLSEKAYSYFTERLKQDIKLLESYQSFIF